MYFIYNQSFFDLSVSLTGSAGYYHVHSCIMHLFTHLEFGLFLWQSQQPLQFLILHSFTVSCAGAALRLWFLSQRVHACGRTERHGRIDRHLLRFLGLEANSAQKCSMG